MFRRFCTMNLTAVDCMQNAVPKGVEWRNNAKIKEHQLGLTKFPLVCFLVALCKSVSDILQPKGTWWCIYFKIQMWCSKLYFSALCCMVDSLSLLIGCTNCKNGCPFTFLFRVVEYKPLFFLRITPVQTQTLNTHAHSPPWTHVRKPYPYEHLQKTVPAHLEINEVTTCASTPLNPRINSGKCHRPCQVEDLNPGG